MSQTLVKLTNRLTPNQKKFVAEVVGTFIVLDSKMHGVLGISFIAFAPFVGVAVGVYMFGKISMAHFNRAVTIGSVKGWFLLSHFIYYFSTYTFPFSRLSLNETSAFNFSENSTILPVVTSHFAPCQGHVTSLPSSLPS